MTEFIIVDAVKGGCGKTTEALASAINSYKNIKATGNDIEEPKICIIDMDLLGTSMEKMISNDLFIKTERKLDQTGTYVKSQANQYLNDLVLSDEAILKEYKTKIVISDKIDNYPVDFIISSPREQDRRKFKVSSNSNYTMQVTPTHFRGTVKRLVEQLMDEEYDTVIFDMPPNSDAYTDCVFDLLLDSEYRKKKEKLIKSVELRIVSTYDKSHIFVNKSWLMDIYRGRDHHWKQFDEILFILNNNSISDNIHIKDLNGSIKKDIEDSLSNSTYKKNVKIKYREYNPNLAKHFSFKTNPADETIDKSFDFSNASSWYTLNDV